MTTQPTVTDAEVARFLKLQNLAGTEDALDDLLESRAAKNAQPTHVYPPCQPQEPCKVCGVSWSKHGSYPTCATHPHSALEQFAQSRQPTHKDAERGEVAKIPPMYLPDGVTSNPEWLTFKH